MKTISIKIALLATSTTAAIGLAVAPSASADDATVTTVGQQAELIDGNIVQGWTITGLRPSSDEIPYTPRGTLWEATATDEAIQGPVQPIVSNLNARAADGENYRVLFGVATAQGVNPAPLAQGEKTTGKVYFDVTGAAPDSVVYNAGGQDLLVWNPAPPPPPVTAGPGDTWTPPAQGEPGQGAAATTPAPAASGSSGTPITEATPSAAPEAGSSGTPVTEATPSAAPEAGSSGTPVTEATPTTPAPAEGSSGTPAPAGTAGTAASTEGSVGTPAAESVPTTTVVGVPHGQGSSGTPVS